ncbi:DNA/RNA nuclease SfsA [Halosimplex amylolyticum]|uniref:DNA/RNA nuclease SfsA n=1 Tax=Halosimplex amylolyticum TaxID=3396616 RepID=UPI003F55F981
MTDTLLSREGDPVAGEFVERENRFVIRVDFGDHVGDVYLGDPGKLRNVLVPGYEILCEPVDDPDRTTDYDAIAIRVDGDGGSDPVQVSLRAALANDLFFATFDAGHLPAFDWAGEVTPEPSLPDHGRADFRLESADGDRTAYVEVKSTTHVDEGVAKFPDRPTERGRRHLRSLESLAADGVEAHLVFVVQRPDVERWEPFREVDPEFADLLAQVADAGVEVHALVTEFDPPHYRLRETDLPVKLD